MHKIFCILSHYMRELEILHLYFYLPYITKSKTILIVRYTLIYVPLRKKCCQLNHSISLVVRCILVWELLCEKVYILQKAKCVNCCVSEIVLGSKWVKWTPREGPWRLTHRVGKMLTSRGQVTNLRDKKVMSREKTTWNYLQERRRPVTGPGCGVGQGYDKYQKVDPRGERSMFSY